MVEPIHSSFRGTEATLSGQIVGLKTIYETLRTGSIFTNVVLNARMNLRKFSKPLHFSLAVCTGSIRCNSNQFRPLLCTSSDCDALPR